MLSEVETWPEGANPIYDAVFAQPFTPERVRRLTDSLGLSRRVEPDVFDSRDHAFAGAEIQFAKRRFCFLWKPLRYPDNLRSREFRPTELETEDTSWGPWPARTSEEARRRLTAASDRTWIEMTVALDLRIEAGDVTVFARSRSPLERCPTRIPPDAWPHFQVIDWRNGVAICQATGERLFSIHIQEHGRAPSDRRQPTETDFAELAAEFERRDAAGLSPLTRDETVAWAAERGLSRAFAREARGRLPDSSKLSPGQKKRDRKRPKSPA